MHSLRRMLSNSDCSNFLSHRKLLHVKLDSFRLRLSRGSFTLGMRRISGCAGAAEQHASFGGELVGGNDTDDDPAAAHMDADVDIDGDASGAAGGSADNNQVLLGVFCKHLFQGFSLPKGRV